jgi:hypothetical protein
MTKKDGGTIKNWQLHKLNFSKAHIDLVYPGENLLPQLISGTVVNDPTGRWQPGYHMQSSLVRKLDREKGCVETRNTVYKLQGTEGIDEVAEQAKAFGKDITDILY